MENRQELPARIELATFRLRSERTTTMLRKPTLSVPNHSTNFNSFSFTIPQQLKFKTLRKPHSLQLPSKCRTRSRALWREMCGIALILSGIRIDISSLTFDSTSPHRKTEKVSAIHSFSIRTDFLPFFFLTPFY